MPLRLLLLSLCLGCGLLSGTALAQLPLLALGPDSLEQPVEVERSLLLEDPRGALSPEQALQGLERRGIPHQGSPRLGYSDSTWWVGFALQTASDSPLRLIIDHPFLEQIELWLYDGDRLLKLGRAP